MGSLLQIGWIVCGLALHSDEQLNIKSEHVDKFWIVLDGMFTLFSTAGPDLDRLS